MLAMCTVARCILCELYVAALAACHHVVFIAAVARVLRNIVGDNFVLVLSRVLMDAVWLAAQCSHGVFAQRLLQPKR